MSACRKDTNIPLLNEGSMLARKIRFTSDRKTIELNLLGSPSTLECTNDIDSSAYLGVKIQGNNLVFTDAISGLTTDLSSPVSDNPLVSIAQSGGVLSIIGLDDTDMGFSVPQMNVRYDAPSNSVKFQI